jgi:hypothetical protein
LAYLPDILAGMTIMNPHKHEFMPLGMLNALLESQRGKCIKCGSLFSHCGGKPGHQVMIPLLHQWPRMDGLICERCAS